MSGGSAVQGAVSIDEARRDMYRTQILGGAEIEFSKAGFANTKMSAIARTADLSLATMYKHFAGKSEIWDALHADRMKDLLAEVEVAVPHPGSALDRILAGVGAVARYLTHHDNYLDMSLWAGTVWASTQETGHGMQRTVWSTGLDTMTAGVELAIANGEISDISPRVGAGLIVASLQVWLAEWAASGRTDDPEELIEAMSERLRWMLVRP